MAYSPNAFQLTHLLQMTYDKLEQTKGLLATGGSTTTIIDTAISSDVEDDAYNGYVAFVAYDAGGAAPEGEYKSVTDYVASTTTLTTAAFSAAVGAGDWISLARGSIFPLNDVIRLCNNALKQMGDVANVDTSLTTASAQTEYSIPATVQYDQIVDVLIPTETDSNDRRLVSVYKNIIPPTSPGGTATLVIPQMDSGYTITIIYTGPHISLRDYDDDISKDVHPTMAVAACALACARWKRNVVGAELMKRLETDYELARMRYPIKKYIPQIGGMPHWDNEKRYQGDQSIYDRWE